MHKYHARINNWLYGIAVFIVLFGPGPAFWCAGGSPDWPQCVSGGRAAGATGQGPDIHPLLPPESGQEKIWRGHKSEQTD